MGRIEFLGVEICHTFFEESKINGSYTSWRGLASFIGTTRAMLDKYRNGKISLSSQRFEKLLSLFSPDRKDFFIKQAIKKPSNWGQKIGGIQAYKINKIFFDLGRKKRWSQIIRNKFGVKYNFDINMHLSKELCEFIGVIIGDGCTNKYGKIYQTNIAGDKLLDKEYYFNDISSICKNLFNISPRIMVRPSGMYINLYSKRVFEILTERFKIPRGVKCYTVRIPQEILEAPKEMVVATLRGMFNTDGGVGLDKRKTYKKPYIRINYTSASKILIEQICK